VRARRGGLLEQRFPAVGSTPVSGGTAVFAEAPSATPNYIFPYVSSTFISDINIFDLQYLLYRPLYNLPTGEELFLSTDPANSSGYSSPVNDSMIGQTLTSSNVQYMYSWQDYLSAQLPMIWQPNADYQLNEIADNLKGVTPLSTTLSINPENWYFTK
jgi:hypothetical protein